MTGPDPLAPVRSALPPLRVASRRLRLLHALADQTNVDAFIVTNLTNVRWLTGFSGSAGFVVVTPSALTLITDGRYEHQAQRELENCGSDAHLVISTHEQREKANRLVDDADRIGLEAEHISWARQLAMQETWFPGVDLIATTGIVDALRRAKDDAELARIERAASITDEALASVLPLLRGGVTERELAGALELAMRERGADGLAFDTIIASGPNGALPHHQPSNRRIDSDELVVIDCGAMVDGYRSDMTRTVLLGQPNDTQQRMFDVVAAAQQSGVETVQVSIPTADIDAACRSVIDAAGWGDAFTHGTGHGVGLDIHELPRIGARATDVCELGDVITVEPGVYLPDVGGVRIEDTVVVTLAGARRLTQTPKHLAIG